MSTLIKSASYSTSTTSLDKENTHSNSSYKQLSRRASLNDITDMTRDKYKVNHIMLKLSQTLKKLKLIR
jgi:hypothetical protein